MLLDTINIFLIITALLNLLLGGVIYSDGSRKKINVVYSLNIVAIIGNFKGLAFEFFEF